VEFSVCKIIASVDGLAIYLHIHVFHLKQHIIWTCEGRVAEVSDRGGIIIHWILRHTSQQATQEFIDAF